MRKIADCWIQLQLSVWIELIDFEFASMKTFCSEKFKLIQSDYCWLIFWGQSTVVDSVEGLEKVGK